MFCWVFCCVFCCVFCWVFVVVPVPFALLVVDVEVVPVVADAAEPDAVLEAAEAADDEADFDDFDDAEEDEADDAEEEELLLAEDTLCEAVTAALELCPDVPGFSTNIAKAPTAPRTATTATMGTTIEAVLRRGVGLKVLGLLWRPLCP